MSAKPTTLITGAAHGIGRATAIALVKKGMPVGLIDRDGAALAEFAQELRADSTAPVGCAAVDVTDRGALISAVNRLASEVGPFEVLVACAGSVRSRSSPSSTPRLAPDSRSQCGRRRSINRSRPAQNDRARTGSHRGDRQHGRISRLPLDDLLLGVEGRPDRLPRSDAPGLSRRGVTVTTVCPGFVRTKMCTDVPYQRPVKMIEPEEAARHLVRAVERRPRNCVFPFSMRFGLAILKYMPDWFFDWMMRLAGPRALHVEF